MLVVIGKGSFAMVHGMCSAFTLKRLCTQSCTFAFFYFTILVLLRIKCCTVMIQFVAGLSDSRLKTIFRRIF